MTKGTLEAFLLYGSRRKIRVQKNETNGFGTLYALNIFVGNA
jgi:hypothetical protein